MSDSQAYEEVTVASDGVAVVKRFEEDEFPVPAIAFKFQSRRDEEVTVRLRDRVPDGVAVEDLGFHPEYGSEYWTVDQDQIRFERAMEAGGEYTTVYGIRATGTDDVEQFLTEPEIEQVDPPLPEDAQEGGEEVVPESDDDVVREVIAGEAEDMPDQDDQEDTTDEEVETLDLKDPNQADEATAGDGASGTAVAGGGGDSGGSTDGGGTGGGDAGGASVDVDGSNLVTALAAEIRQNNVSAEDVKLLRQAFEIAGQEGGSVVARIQRLQSDVSDLRAYTDALEEFLDESGTAKQVIEGFESDIEELESHLAQVQSKMGENSKEVASVSEEVSNLETAVSNVQDDVDGFVDELDDVGADVEDVRTIVRDVRDTVDAVSAEVDEVREEVDGVDTDVTDVRQDLEGVRQDVDGVTGDVDEIQDAIDDVQNEVDDLRADVADVDVEERLDHLAQEIEDLQEWQDQIKETFGGGN